MKRKSVIFKHRGKKKGARAAQNLRSLEILKGELDVEPLSINIHPTTIGFSFNSDYDQQLEIEIEIKNADSVHSGGTQPCF